MIKIANYNWNMPKTPSKMHMHDMVKIVTIVFEIVGAGRVLKPPPPLDVSCLKYPGWDRVNPLLTSQETVVYF